MNRALAAITILAALVLATACGTRATPSAANGDAGSMERADAAPTDGCAACSGGTCMLGRCVIILATGQGASGVVVDSANAYWTNGYSMRGGPGAVVKAPLAGAAPITLFDQQYGASGIAVAGGNVYWSAHPDQSAADGGTILSGAVDGGGTVSTLATGQFYTQAVAVDSNYVYWNSGAIAKAPIDGGPVTTLVSSAPATSFYATQLALDATNVYFVTNTSIAGRVMRVPKAGGTPQTLAFEQTSEQAVAVDGANVYWTNGSGDVMKEAVDGGSRVPLAYQQNAATWIAVDATSVYWTSGNGDVMGGGVLETSLDGGAVTTVTSGWRSLAGLAVAATSVSFPTFDGNIVRVTPK